jgi:hypothetical protein
VLVLEAVSSFLEPFSSKNWLLNTIFPRKIDFWIPPPPALRGLLSSRLFVVAEETDRVQRALCTPNPKPQTHCQLLAVIHFRRWFTFGVDLCRRLIGRRRTLQYHHFHFWRWSIFGVDLRLALIYFWCWFGVDLLSALIYFWRWSTFGVDFLLALTYAGGGLGEGGQFGTIVVNFRRRFTFGVDLRWLMQEIDGA